MWVMLNLDAPTPQNGQHTQIRRQNVNIVSLIRLRYLKN